MELGVLVICVYDSTSMSSVYIYIYIYTIYIYRCVYVCIYIYIYASSCGSLKDDPDKIVQKDVIFFA